MKNGIIIIITLAIALVIITTLFFINKNKISDENQSLEIETQGLTPEEKRWVEIIDSAFEPVNCPTPPPHPSNLENYYYGPLIDTHIHIAPIPDDLDFELSEDEVRPVLGANVKMEDWVCMLNYENTSKVFAFFPVWEPVPQFLKVVNKTLEKYPGRFVPFIMPPDHDDRIDGFPTVNAETLAEMLSYHPGMFHGYGEIGLYERGDHGGPKGSPALPPDSERLNEIYPIVRENNLVIYFHLGEGMKESFDRTLKANPDINFIFHGDQLISSTDNGKQNLSNIDDLLTNNPNLYYGIDELYGGVWLIKPEVSKEEFLAHFKNYEPLLEEDLKTFRDFIVEHQDQVLWGTDRGWSSPWSLDTEVAITLNNYSRTFIGHLPPEVQEKFAYKNAERLLEN